METREKQNLLTMIIIVAFLAIALIVGFIIYPEIIENNKSNSLNSQSTKQTENTNITTNSTQTTSTTNTETTSTASTNGYVGEEEKESDASQTTSTSQTKEEKAIELAKKEWGENDSNVTYNVEQKEGNVYYIAVRLNDQVQKWYEVNTEKWTRILIHNIRIIFLRKFVNIMIF